MAVTILPAFPNEPVDSMLRRLKRAAENEGMRADFRRHEWFTPRPQARRTKSARARRRKGDAQ